MLAARAGPACRAVGDQAWLPPDPATPAAGRPPDLAPPARWRAARQTLAQGTGRSRPLAGHASPGGQLTAAHWPAGGT